MHFIKAILNKTYQPFVKHYLLKKRVYKYKGHNFIVFPGVFHPGIFFSSKFLLKHLLLFPIKKKSLLEVGVGSGFIAINAAKAGAVVTGIDISLAAINNSILNAANICVAVQFIQSDLFSKLQIQKFDFIVVNPPYFKKNPIIETEYAWYCGENGEYFSNFFKELKNFTHVNSIVLMVLSEECDIDFIKNEALKRNFTFNKIKQKRFWWESNYIFKIQPKVAH